MHKLGLMVILQLALVGCSGLPNNAIATSTPISAASPVAEESEVTPGHWSYEGETGPEHWAELSDGKQGTYSTCGSDKLQSPINLVPRSTADLSNIIFNYQPSDVQIKNNGHTVEVDYSKGGSITIDGQTYQTINIHYHFPSEHTIDGQRFAAEIHLVHAIDPNLATKEYAVVGILLTPGAENPAYQALLSQLPTEANQVLTSVEPINAADLLPSVQTSYRYTGSLTTPPCTEGVHWNVMATPVELSSAQLARLQAVFEGNARPLQALNQQQVIEDTTP